MEKSHATSYSKGIKKPLIILTILFFAITFCKSQSNINTRNKHYNNVQNIIIFIASYDSKLSETNVLDYLNNTQNVWINNNGSIEFKDKEKVIIYLDDQLLPFSGNNLIEYLKSLHSNILDKIEILFNPSEKYKVSENVGVINIITRKFPTKPFFIPIKGTSPLVSCKFYLAHHS
jgi:hypothetical protein